MVLYSIEDVDTVPFFYLTYIKEKTFSHNR